MYENTQKIKQTNSHVQKQPKIKQTGMSKTSKQPNKRTSEIYYYYYKDLFTHKDINTYINGVV